MRIWDLNSWRYIEDDNVTADFGLAGDEFLMSLYHPSVPKTEPTLRLYTYRSHCALVGRFQNIEAELDLEACRQHDVPFSRRPTGGGAILMGADQLGLCLTASAATFKNVRRPLEMYKEFSIPVIRALDRLGIKAAFRPKNDLEVNGRKIAGLGVAFDPHGAMLFHTSLLVDLDIPLMLRVLRIPAEKISDKRTTNSVAERVTTVCEQLQQKITTDEVRNIVKTSFAKTFGVDFHVVSWQHSDTTRIEALAREKYANADWIFQRSPQPDMTGVSVQKTAAGLLRTYIGLKGEIIKSVLITGDFFEASTIFNQIEAKLKWSPLQKDSIAKVVKDVVSKNGETTQSVSCKQVIEAIWKAGLNAQAKNRLTNKGSCYYPLSKTPAEI